MQDRLIRINGVKTATGYCRASIYRLIALGRFPRPVRLAGGGAVAWRASEVQAWIAAQPKTVATEKAAPQLEAA